MVSQLASKVLLAIFRIRLQDYRETWSQQKRRVLAAIPPLPSLFCFVCRVSTLNALRARPAACPLIPDHEMVDLCELDEFGC